MNKTIQNMILKKYAPDLANRFDVELDGFKIKLTEKATGRTKTYEIKLVPVD